MSEELHVAVAVLQRADGRVLVAERAAWRHAGGGLEFPGGKIDRGETLAAALGRELCEELGVQLRRWRPLMLVRHQYPGRRVVLHVCRVEDWCGQARGVEDQRLAWEAPSALAHERFPAANRPIVAALQWPDRCLVTPTPGEEMPVRAVIEGLQAAIAGGVRLVQLRAPGLGPAAWERLLAAACTLAAQAPDRVRLLANTDDPGCLTRHPGLAGLHLGARAARALAQRPLARDRMLSCACHDAEEIRHAEELDADLVVVGSVRPTPTHPQGGSLGWHGLAELTATTTLPVYAIGGLDATDIATARAHGAIGIAAIRGLWPAA